MDTSSLASKEELEALRNEVITNEEIVASSLNDLEDRKADKEYVEDALGNLDIDIDTSTLVTKDEFTDVEEVWAASYNLLNQKISDVQQYIYDEAASRRQFDEAIAEIQSIIAENESVVTAAWNQLNTRINALEAAQAQGE
jgi:chromosome segregation ATPase